MALGDAAEKHPATLSGRLRRPPAFAQALTARPRILLPGEPFGPLDPGTRLAMHGFLYDLLAETRMTILVVTCNLRGAFKLGDRVLILDEMHQDPDEPNSYGATISYGFDARSGGIPFQTASTFT